MRVGDDLAPDYNAWRRKRDAQDRFVFSLFMWAVILLEVLAVYKGIERYLQW